MIIDFLKHIGFDIIMYDHGNFSAYYKDKYTGNEIFGRKLDEWISFDIKSTVLSGNILHSDTITTYKDIQIEFLSNGLTAYKYYPDLNVGGYRATRIHKGNCPG